MRHDFITPSFVLYSFLGSATLQGFASPSARVPSGLMAGAVYSGLFTLLRYSRFTPKQNTAPLEMELQG